MSGIYRISNMANGRVYIGSAINLERRQYEHFKALRGGYHGNRFLQNAWNKYGKDAFKFDVIEVVDNCDLLLAAEQRHIDAAFAAAPSKKVQPYNICKTAGNLLGTKRTVECRARMAALKLGKKRCPIGVAKQAAKMRGRKKRAESITKRTMSRAGFRHTDETKAKIAEAKKGVPIHTEEWKAYMSSKMTGRKMPKEHGEKLREAHRSLSKEQVAEIVKRRKAGESYISLAKAFNSTKDTVRNWCLREGLEKVNLPLTDQQVSEILRRHQAGQNYVQIAKAMGISDNTVWRKVSGYKTPTAAEKRAAMAAPDIILTPEPTADPDPKQLSFL
jgi:DNA-directed RNA polymerase specialized sigma24 family protein